MRTFYRFESLTLGALALVAAMSFGREALGQSIDEEDIRYFEQLDAEHEAQ
jgi:hypothetical protein